MENTALDLMRWAKKELEDANVSPATGDAEMLSKLIRAVYALGRVLSDVRAVKSGKVGRRIGRRYTGRKAGKFLNRLWK